ncbi:MAG: conjugal transfer protein TraX, partial [Lachnospiraceae bacterium]|nr:conjugal transfer protein TraX [Lachnospiraceae bacterium]
IKYLVIIAMLIDHIAWAFVPMNTVLDQVMHFIGRLTGPTMAYFLAEGYLHTRNVKKYAARLGIFALLSWIPFIFFEYGTLPITIIEGKPIRGIFLYLSSKKITIAFYPFFCVIYTLLLSLLAIWLWDKGRCPKRCKVFGIIGICILSTPGDWPVFDVLFALYFFIYREQPKYPCSVHMPPVRFYHMRNIQDVSGL